MDLGNATVSVALGDLNAMQRKIAELEKENSDLRKMAEDTKLGDVDSEARGYKKAFESTLVLARFLMSHDPKMLRGWPYQAMFELADQIESRAGISSFDRETVNDIRMMARECQKWEEARARGDEQSLLASESGHKSPAGLQA
jgi:hypothetical protein